VNRPAATAVRHDHAAQGRRHAQPGATGPSHLDVAVPHVLSVQQEALERVEPRRRRRRSAAHPLLDGAGWGAGACQHSTSQAHH
jgi:hypothetical protein